MSAIILYPRDWLLVGPRPEIIVKCPHNRSEFYIEVMLIENDGKQTRVDIATTVCGRSASGTIRCLSIANDLAPGRYVFGIFDIRHNFRLAEIGLFVNSDNLVSLVDSLDVIETLYWQCFQLRFIGNGPGKSGTTWSYRLLGSLPGCRTVNMGERGLHGLDPAELARVAFSESYHGHLGFGLDIIEKINKLDFVMIHSCRDLRDQIVSEYFHLFRMQMGDYRPDIAHRSSESLLSFESIHSWSTSLYRAYDALAWKDSLDCVVIRYEDLIDDTSSTLRAALSSYGLMLDVPLAQYIADMNDFAALTGRQKGDADPTSPLRNGEVGSWRQHLSCDTANRIYDRYQRYFEAFGYQS